MFVDPEGHFEAMIRVSWCLGDLGRVLRELDVFDLPNWDILVHDISGLKVQNFQVGCFRETA